MRQSREPCTPRAFGGQALGGEGAADEAGVPFPAVRMMQ